MQLCLWAKHSTYLDSSVCMYVYELECEWMIDALCLKHDNERWCLYVYIPCLIIFLTIFQRIWMISHCHPYLMFVWIHLLSDVYLLFSNHNDRNYPNENRFLCCHSYSLITLCFSCLYLVSFKHLQTVYFILRRKSP